MNKEIEEIEKEVNGEYTYINSFKAMEYMKTLLSKIKELETDDRSRSERFIEIGDKYESLKFKVFDLEQRLKELQEERDGYKNGQIQLQGMVSDLMDVNAKWVGKVKELDSELSKWEPPHEDSELEDMKEQSEQSFLSAKQVYINALEWKIKHVELNFKRLQEAVDRHEIFKRAHEKVVALEDEALYLIRKKEGMSDE